MRLIIKDYLLQLKEKDELDLLLCNLLFQMGYVTENKPETGNRQYGVDIRAHNDGEILLCVVKQGNLTRRNWDSDQNSVRQSLNEIKDTYLGLINEKELRKLLHIVVVTNGLMDEAVRPNWEGFVKQYLDWNKIKVEVDFWNIDKLVDDIQRYLFDEHLFSGKIQQLLRQALYFIGEGDYRNEYFEQIVNSFIAQLNDTDTPKARTKKIAGLYLATQMIAQYAANVRIYKISIMVSEYLIIRYWKYLLEHQKLEKDLYVEWLLKFLLSYKMWCQKYFEAVKCICEGPNRLPAYNPIEERVVLYEILGYLITYAYYLSFLGEHDVDSRTTCRQIYNSIINLINNYPQIFYAPYDRHIGVVSMLYRLMDRMEQGNDIPLLIQHQCTISKFYYLWYNKYPTATDSFEDAVNIDMGFPAEDYITSAFWGTLLEWIVIMGQADLYQEIEQFLKESFAEVTKCTWFLRADEEIKFYDPYAMNLTGEGVAIDIEASFDQLTEKVQFVMQQYENEKFSFETFGFAALEFITSRYYGYLVRVKREHCIYN